MENCILPTEMILYIIDYCDEYGKLNFKNTCSELRESFVNETYNEECNRYFAHIKACIELHIRDFNHYVYYDSTTMKPIGKNDANTLRESIDMIFKSNKFKLNNILLPLICINETNGRKYSVLYDGVSIKTNSIVNNKNEQKEVTYSIYYNDELYGTYRGVNPIQAAKKAFNKLLHKLNNYGQNTINELDFAIKRKGIYGKLYYFHGKRTKLIYPITMGVFNRQIVYNYKSEVTKIKRAKSFTITPAK
jgi:hypothetical protein